VNRLRGEVLVTEVMEWQRGRPVPREVPKSDAGRRSVGLPSLVAVALDAHLSEFGPTDEGLVFGSPDGGRLRKDNFRRRTWAPAREAAGLDPEVRFHDLRHTAASLMIRARADVLTLARRLGHAKPSYTMDLYGHWFPDEDSALRSSLDSMIETRSLDGEQTNVVRLVR
jgi:integrase